MIKNENKIETIGDPNLGNIVANIGGNKPCSAIPHSCQLTSKLFEMKAPIVPSTEDARITYIRGSPPMF